MAEKINLTDNAKKVLALRYLKKNDNGEPIEEPEDLFLRVAENIASIEKNPEKWTKIFYDVMANLEFLPNSPTLMNAGRELQQLSACFVLPVGDSMEEIFEAVKNTALIHKSGGGTGFSFSRLRPANDRVKSTKGVSSGPLSFMKVFDVATETVKQGGCFVGDTLVATVKGPRKIKELKKGELLYSMSEKGYVLRPCSDSWLTIKNAEVWKITTDKGLIIYATKNHPIMPKVDFDFEKKNYVKIEDLKPGFSLMSMGSYIHKIASVEVSHIEDVYNVEVEDTHNFVVCNDTMSTGVVVSNTRRGANMGILDVSHPDILDFISIKEKDGVLSNFNISVAITDEFMKALEDDTEYPLRNPRSGQIVSYLKASDVFKKIINCAWKNGEPGIIFIDKINDKNPTPHVGKVESTNPCLAGETLVAVADGRIAVPIKQLAEEDKDVPVYCRNDEGKVTIRMMRHPRVTAEEAEVYNVTLDDGSVIKATANHKILLSDNHMVKVSDLKYGDSVHILNKKLASFHEIIEKCRTTSLKEYYWISNRPEHRIIYEFYNGPIPKGYVIHHYNFDSKDNRIENLKCMTVEAHNDLHKEGKIGDKNPMRRAQTEWSEEKWQQYHDNMSEAVSGELNGRFSGISNETLFTIAVELSKEYKRKLSVHDWEQIALKNGYPSQFSEYRIKVFGTVSDFLDKAAIVAEVPGTGLNHAHLTGFINFLRIKETSDLDLFFDETYNECIRVRKICEGCGKNFIVPYSHREQGYCSISCANKNREITEYDLRKRRETKNVIREQKRIQQINAFNDLKLQIGRIPMKKEYTVYCKNNRIPFRLPVKREIANGILIGTFTDWEDLKEKSLQYNHRVVSIEYAGKVPVYNGTVDDFHNFYFGGFKNIADGREKIVFINGENCGEQPLLPYESCNLGSINLIKIIDENNDINFDKLEGIVKIAVRFLDNVIDLNKYPLPSIDKMTKSNRKIGLGVMGFADMLIKLGIPYNSPEALNLAEKIMKLIQEKGREESRALAKDRGIFPNFKGSIYDNGPELRNATITTIAPTGTLSMIASCSSGIEPLFSLVYEKNVLDGRKFLEVHPEFLKVAKQEGFYSENLMKQVMKSGSISEIQEIPQKIRDTFVTAHDVDPKTHINIQAAFQKYTDNAVSKTINFRHDATIKDVETAYKMAYESGCKGVTVYRDGSRGNQVMTVGSSEKPNKIIARDIKLPTIFNNGPTRIIKKEGKKFYLHFSYLPEDTRNEFPVVFWIHTNAKYKADELKVCNKAARNLATLALTSGVDHKFVNETIDKANADYPHNRLGRMVSLCLRHNVPREDILVSLSDIDGDNISTLLTAVRKFLSETLPNGTVLRGLKCPECGAVLIMQENCKRCSSCTWTACG
jgi:ribonucleotide reductase alpha subunit